MNPVDEVLEFYKRNNIPIPKITEPTKETLDAMEHNRRINLHRYGDPDGYLFDYDEDDSDEDINKTKEEYVYVSNK